MKNLMIYISPTGSFNNPRPDLSSNDAGPLIKVQIENSLDLGWKKEDILIVTNFAYQYGEFKTLALNGVEFFERKPQATKINAILKMFEGDLIDKDELYFFHDIDAFQLEPLTEAEIDLARDGLATTDYGGGIYFAGEGRLNTGVIFFRFGSKDILERTKEIYYKKRIDEEEALMLLMIEDPKIRKRVKLLDNTYNFNGYNLRLCYKRSLKPLKIVHFHPLTGNRRLNTDNNLKFFKGENPINTPLITDRLIKIFRYHRIV